MENTNTQSPIRILVIEDDVFVRDLYVRTLEKRGYAVDVAIDGEEGTQKIHQAQHDIILLDIMLPKKNGIDILREVKADPKLKDIPIFLLSNLGQEAIIKDAFKVGAAGYLLKARLLPEDVADTIDNFISTGKLPPETQKI